MSFGSKVSSRTIRCIEHACVSSRGAQSTELVSLYIGYCTLNNYYYYYYYYYCHVLCNVVYFEVQIALIFYRSGVNRVQVVLSGFSMILFCLVQVNTLCRYGCMHFFAALVLVCSSR